MRQIAVRNGRPIVRLCNAKGVSWSSKSPTLTAIGDEKKKTFTTEGAGNGFAVERSRDFNVDFINFSRTSTKN